MKTTKAKPNLKAASSPAKSYSVHPTHVAITSFWDEEYVDLLLDPILSEEKESDESPVPIAEASLHNLARVAMNAPRKMDHDDYDDDDEDEDEDTDEDDDDDNDLDDDGEDEDMEEEEDDDDVEELDEDDDE